MTQEDTSTPHALPAERCLALFGSRFEGLSAMRFSHAAGLFPQLADPPRCSQRSSNMSAESSSEGCQLKKAVNRRLLRHDGHEKTKFCSNSLLARALELSAGPFRRV